MDQKKILSTVKKLNDYIIEHNISDFRIDRMENDTLYLVGSFDLSYYHDIEVQITNVGSLSLASDFWVDLSKAEPFYIEFPTLTAAILKFEDCSEQRIEKICFEGELSFIIKHVSYF